MRTVDRERRVDDEPIGCHRAVLHQPAASIELHLQRRRSVGKPRRHQCDEEKVIEEGSAERGVEKVVAESVVGCFFRQRKIPGVVVSHHQAFRVADRGEPIHPPAVDLRLLLVKPVDQVRCLGVERYVFLDVERRVGKISGERVSWRLRQLPVRRTRPIYLGRALASAGETVGAGKFAVEIVEAVVLQIDDDDVLELVEALIAVRRVGARCRRALRSARARGARRRIARARGKEKDDRDANDRNPNRRFQSNP